MGEAEILQAWYEAHGYRDEADYLAETRSARVEEIGLNIYTITGSEEEAQREMEAFREYQGWTETVKPVVPTIPKDVMPLVQYDGQATQLVTGVVVPLADELWLSGEAEMMEFWDGEVDTEEAFIRGFEKEITVDFRAGNSPLVVAALLSAWRLVAPFVLPLVVGLLAGWLSGGIGSGGRRVSIYRGGRLIGYADGKVTSVGRVKLQTRKV